MKSHFFAMLARMKFIRRWGLMRNTQEENIQEHTLQTAAIAYHLCVLSNTYYGGHTDPKEAAVLAMYHDVPEIYTGDMPTPVKYFSEDMRRTYGQVEKLAQERLLKLLPAELQEAYRPLICEAEKNPLWPYVKAADTLSAYVKCVQEMAAGNSEFKDAYHTIGAKLEQLDMPEVARFLAEYVPSFRLSLDEINKNKR
ncbi:MAG: 5'-deoxynucleotidase [Megasphaera sp.]|jgi:5'-deoxynucleotidase|nr:5'-deoxynucleotidase [Megasphaera sp.]MCH4188371.1 5'-deoxynucleotidase [Megasphaera sp.]MCH4218210.1 5'-deoxynucleotidase [Megasphaera sp.]